MSVPLPATMTRDMSRPMCSANEPVGTTCQRNASRFARFSVREVPLARGRHVDPQVVRLGDGVVVDRDGRRIKDALRHAQDPRLDHLRRRQPWAEATPDERRGRRQHDAQEPELIAQRPSSPGVQDGRAGPIRQPAEEVDSSEVAAPSQPALLEHHAPARGLRRAMCLPGRHRRGHVRRCALPLEDGRREPIADDAPVIDLLGHATSAPADLARAFRIRDELAQRVGEVFDGIAGW